MLNNSTSLIFYTLTKKHLHRQTHTLSLSVTRTHTQMHTHINGLFLLSLKNEKPAMSNFLQLIHICSKHREA